MYHHTRSFRTHLGTVILITSFAGTNCHLHLSRNHDLSKNLIFPKTLVANDMHSMFQKKKKICIQVMKKVTCIKLSLFADDMILYMENPIAATKKLSELLSEISKVAGYESNIQNSVTFLYTNNNPSE